MTLDFKSISFVAIWTPSFAATAATQPLHQATPFTANLLGVSVPVVTAIVAVVGVLLARPLSPKGNPPLSLGRNLAVSAILALLALVWVIDSQPGLLFALVVSIGLGFAGFSVIELIGAQIMASLRRAIGQPPPPPDQPDLFAQPDTPEDSRHAAD
ncbi:hypothetical protein [Blastomonas sp.]|uniref:hypothetical protein n=1 Tax=Blastomonas sp. TaxID=1909299 RepID=UPI0017C7B72B|nr:hypothetical protein [Blastomonas sp.]